MAETTVVDPAAIEAMRERLAGRIHHTPMLSSATAARVVAAAGPGRGVADGRVYLKAEHLQKTGSFKPRAALARISSLTADERSPRGDHDLGRERRPGLRVGGAARPACRSRS